MTPNPSLSADELVQANAELQRVNRALRVISACNQAMLRADDQTTLFKEICGAIVELGGYRLAWVGIAEHDEIKSVRPIAYVGFEQGYLESAQITWADTERGQGPTGTAIRTGAPVVVTRILTDPMMSPWRAEATRRGYAASVALALRINGTVVGALNIYAADEDAFAGDELRLLTEAADDLSFGLTALRHRSEYAKLQSALRKSEDRLRAAVEGSLDALIILSPVYDEAGSVSDFTLLDVNPRAEAQLGLTRDALLGRRLSETFHALHEQLMPRFLPVLETGEAIEERFPLSTPGGRTIWAHHQVVPVEEGIAVIWRDITEETLSAQRLSASEKSHRELLQSLLEGILALDPEGIVAFVNAPMAQMLGYSVEEMHGTSLFNYMDKRLVESMKAHRRPRAEGAKERYEFEFRHKNGNPVFLDIEAGPRFNETGEFIGTIAGVMDVTQRRKTEDELRASLEMLRKAEELARLGTWSLDPASGNITGSAEMQRLLGLPPETAVISFKAALELFRPDERAEVAEAFAAMGKGEPQQNERRVVQPNGEELVLLFQSAPVRDETGRVVRVDGFAQDITERKRDERRLEYLATHDALTDLPNRRVLEDRMMQTIAHLGRSPGEVLAVLYLDLDRFKFVNDSLGHSFGDEVLKTVARLLESTIRKGDTVARQGGDEFIILLRDIRQPSHVMVVAEKLQQAFAKPLLIQGRELYVTFSIGASLYPTDGADIETLLKNADAAMYRAKQASGSIQFYTRAMSEQASERVRLEHDLRRALENGEFELHYQPQVAFTDGRILGAEALIRWRHPSEGVISPNRFIPIAVDTGLIGPIGEWVLQVACEQNQQWRASGLAPIRVAVNVAASQFHNGRIEDMVTAMAKRGAISTSSLELEITERVLMSNAEDAIGRLGRLKALGVHIAIDDFGTGYSSLSYLRRLPIDKIKIDQSFVRDLTSDDDAKTLVRAIIDLSHAFGFTVIAEGVETAQQALFLAQHGCEQCQGYYFARPMPPEQFESLLRKGCLALPT